MTITKEVTTVEKVDLEVETPYYFKSNDAVYKVVGPQTWVRVLTSVTESYLSITFCNNLSPDDIEKGEQIFETEFLVAFERVLHKIESIVS